jgi:hypothetical protein
MAVKLIARLDSAGDELGAGRAISKRLIENAIECTQYVVSGEAFVQEIAKEFGVTEAAARQLALVHASYLSAHIKKYK